MLWDEFEPTKLIDDSSRGDFAFEGSRIFWRGIAAAHANSHESEPTKLMDDSPRNDFASEGSRIFWVGKPRMRTLHTPCALPRLYTLAPRAPSQGHSVGGYCHRSGRTKTCQDFCSARCSLMHSSDTWRITKLGVFVPVVPAFFLLLVLCKFAPLLTSSKLQ
jgi:hypothetical protein